MIDFCDLELLAVTEPFLETSFTVLMWIPYHALTFVAGNVHTPTLHQGKWPFP